MKVRWVKCDECGKSSICVVTKKGNMCEACCMKDIDRRFNK